MVIFILSRLMPFPFAHFRDVMEYQDGQSWIDKLEYYEMRVLIL